jgi:hypothetical protein
MLMRKRHLIVGVVMLVASAVSFDLVQTAATPSAAELVDARDDVGLTASATPLVVAAPGMIETLDSLSDAAILLAAGAALFAVAAGVRRHTA